MPIIASDNGSKEFEKPQPGQYSAVCYRVVDLGTQPVKNRDGSTSYKRKIQISWEIDERMTEGEYSGKRFSIHNRYTLSLNEKSNLRPVLESWRGRAFTADEAKAFDISKLIGVPCYMQITHNKAENGKVYANMTSIMALPKGMTPLQPENETFEFSLDSFDQAVFEKLSDSLKQTISNSPEHKALSTPNSQAIAAAASAPVDDDAIPF